MTDTATGARQAMPKIQKTVMLPESLCHLIEAHLDRSGTTLARMVAASILQYLLSRAWGPDKFWMLLATELEKEGVTFGDVLKKLARRFDDDLDDRHNEAVEAGIDQETYLGNKLLQNKRGTAMVFKQLSQSDDPLQALAAWWDRGAPQKEYVAE